MSAGNRSVRAGRNGADNGHRRCCSSIGSRCAVFADVRCAIIQRMALGLAFGVGVDDIPLVAESIAERQGVAIAFRPLGYRRRAYEDRFQPHQRTARQSF